MSTGVATLRAMTAADWPGVRAVYAEGVASGNATLDPSLPDWPAWDAARLPHSRLVELDPSGAVAGWAALTASSSRCVFTGVAEVSVYVAAEARGQGLGARLLQALIESSEREGLWTLQASILPENEPSVAIHERCGFRLVGRQERIGQLGGVWRDVLLLERRSPVVGI